MVWQSLAKQDLAIAARTSSGCKFSFKSAKRGSVYVAYGDTPVPVGKDPEDTAGMIETYVDLVQGLLAQ